jgi:nickel transport protein
MGCWCYDFYIRNTSFFFEGIPMAAKRLAWCLPLILIASLNPPRALAHGVDGTYSTDQAVTVTFRYDEDNPVARCEFEVFDPTMGEAFQTGKTDPLGRVVFRPDQPGRWQVRVWTEDGHGSTVQVMVDENLVVTGGPDGRTGRMQKVITGVSILFGVFGVLALIRKPR